MSIAVDSHVALASIAKGRSPSLGLRQCLRRIAAIVLAGDLYPALHFAPTRLNPADHPSRMRELLEALKSFRAENLTKKELFQLARVSGLRRASANWVRLFLFVAGGRVPWWSSDESWRFKHWGLRNFPFEKSVLDFGRDLSRSLDFGSEPKCDLDFDQTLGFPGEGPGLRPFWILICSLDFLLVDFHAVLLRFALSVDFGFKGAHAGGLLFSSRLVGKVNGAVSLGSAVSVSHGFLEPRDKVDLQRAKMREGLELAEGRPVLERTQRGREKLLEIFDAWLEQFGLSVSYLADPGGADVETINMLLSRYGRELFAAGRPYGHYSETVNGMASRRPAIRRMLQGAWDVAYSWLREEPPVHHLAMPWQVLLSLVAVALAWGWTREAGV